MENGKNFKFFPESPLPAAGSSRSGDLPAYLSNPGSRILATGRAEKFFLSLPTTPHFEICQTKRLIFSLLPTTDKNQKCQTPGKKNFSFTYYYNLNRAKWPETEPGNKKSSKSFSDLLLSLVAGGRLVFSFSAYRSKRNLNSAAISCCFTYSSTSAFT